MTKQSAISYRQWKRYLSTLSLLCFLFYAVSPLPAGLIQDNSGGCWAGPLSPLCTGLPLLKTFAVEFHNEADRGVASPFTLFLFFYTKQLILPPILNIPGIDASMPACRTRGGKVSTRLAVSLFFSDVETNEPLPELYLIHSGLSPPAVRLTCCYMSPKTLLSP